MTAIDHEATQDAADASVRVTYSRSVVIQGRHSTPATGLLRSLVVAAVGFLVAITPRPLATFFGLFVGASAAQIVAVGLATAVVLAALLRAGAIVATDERVLTAFARWDVERRLHLERYSLVLAILATLAIISLVFLGTQVRSIP